MRDLHLYLQYYQIKCPQLTSLIKQGKTSLCKIFHITNMDAAVLNAHINDAYSVVYYAE